MTALNTNSGLGPGPGLVISTPSGVLMRLDVNGWSPTGTGNYGPVTVMKPTGGISTSGSGSLSLSGYNVSGRQGTLDAVFTTGAAQAGSDQLVAAVVDQLPSPGGYAAILLDELNRPFCVLKDVNGTLVAETTPIGPAIPAGIMLHAVLEWNSAGPIDGADYVTFVLGEVALGNWAAEALKSWSPFQPTILATASSFGSYVPLSGTIGNVQLGGGQGTFIPPLANASQTTTCEIVGQSSTSIAAKAQYKAAATPTGQATVSAAPNVTHKATATITVTAVIVANATKSGP
jgi:hypothetical protein